MQAESVSREDIVATFRSAMVGHFRSHVPGTSINESTLIAGDYLNHSTSSLMLLETIGAEPTEFADDLMSWRPRTYEEHFSESGFRDRNLAIAAYRRAPPRPLRRGRGKVARRSLDHCRRGGRRAWQSQHRLDRTCEHAAQRLRVLIDEANASPTARRCRAGRRRQVG